MVVCFCVAHALLHAELLAIIQILIWWCTGGHHLRHHAHAGAARSLRLFFNRQSGGRGRAVAVMPVLLLLPALPQGVANNPSLHRLAALLFNRYVLFELVSLVLLAVMVGATLARREERD